MDAQMLQGTNNQVQMNTSPAPQTLIQNSNGWSNFWDTVKNWWNTYINYYNSYSGPHIGQSNNVVQDSQALLGKQYNDWADMINYYYGSPSDNPAGSQEASDSTQNWIDDALEKGLNSANEQWLRAAEYNSREAQKNREWQEYMSNTQYQRAVADLKKAGINPLLAFDSLSGASVPSGSAGSISSYNTNSLYTGMMSSILGDKKIQAALLTIFSSVITSLVKSAGNGLAALFG